MLIFRLQQPAVLVTDMLFEALRDCSRLDAASTLVLAL